MATTKRGIEVKGLRELLKELNSYGRDVSRAVRVEAKAIAETEAGRIQSRAAASGNKLAASVGVSVRPRSDRVPAIISGGARRINNVSGRPAAGAAFFGAEFGGGARKTTKQFRPHRGRQGYFFWPQIREDEKEILERWLDAVDEVLARGAFVIGG